MQPVKTYFVTGATGAIGSALVPILLEDAATQVRLLIRAKSVEDLNARLEVLYRFWEIAPENMAFRERMQALRGDVTLPRFGLDEAVYSALSADCTHMIHAAGNVRMNLPIEEARRSAVDAARNVVELALAGSRLEKIEFVSTVGVGGRRPGVLPETWILEPREFHNTYEQAKAEAELEIQQAIVEYALPITVHRPSMVVGDSRTGKIIHFQVFYHLCEFLSGRRTFGFYPAFGNALLDIVPADAVAHAIAWSSQTPVTIGQILHLCAGPELAVNLVELRKCVRSAFAAAGMRTPHTVTVSRHLFYVAARAIAMVAGAETRRAIRTLPVFLDYLTTEQTFGNTLTQDRLGIAGLRIPPPETYLAVVLDYYLSSRLQQRCGTA